MSLRIVSLLRIFVVIAVVGIVVLGIAFVQALLLGDDTTPRTAAERAIASAEEAVRANPDDAVARSRLAAAYLEQGSPTKAIEQAEFALRLNPEMPDAYFVLGEAKLRNNDIEGAIASLTSAANMTGQFAPFYQEVWVALARAQEQAKDYKAALDSFQNALQYGPDNATIYIERGQMLERRENWFEAAYDYAYTLLILPDSAEAKEGLARIEKGQPEDYAKAIDLVNKSREALGEAPHGDASATVEP